jgi:hypothetical protein
VISDEELLQSAEGADRALSRLGPARHRPDPPSCTGTLTHLVLSFRLPHDW